jgi:hypothetical protein
MFQGFSMNMFPFLAVVWYVGFSVLDRLAILGELAIAQVSTTTGASMLDWTKYLGALGILAWYLWYDSTKQRPRIAEEHRKEREMQRAEHSVERSAMAAEHRDERDDLVSRLDIQDEKHQANITKLICDSQKQ